jgi:hypothetical protein
MALLDTYDIYTNHHNNCYADLIHHLTAFAHYIEQIIKKYGVYKQLQKIVRDTVREERFIINNLLHPQKANLSKA